MSYMLKQVWLKLQHIFRDLICLPEDWAMELGPKKTLLCYLRNVTCQPPGQYCPSVSHLIISGVGVINARELPTAAYVLH